MKFEALRAVTLVSFDFVLTGIEFQSFGRVAFLLSR